MEHCVNPRRFALRAATSAAHAALEQDIGEIVSRQDYVRYLRTMTRFRSAVEPPLEGLPGPGLFEPTMIRECLIKDCDDLGVVAPAPLTSEIDGAGERRLGVIYVLEGSALGASLLIRSAKALGFDAAYGARHLTRQVERRGNWTAFLEHLDHVPSLDMEQVIEAANATFALARAAAMDAVHAS